MKNGDRKKIMLRPILIGFAILLCAIFLRSFILTDRGEKSIITTSTLKRAVNVSELSTAQFTYNGIAEVYEDERKESVECYIRYNAKVKAGIDMSDIDFDVDHDTKTVTVILPEIEITANPVDEKSLSFIPDDTTIELDDALLTCKEDARREALASTELLYTAEENLKSIMQGLLYPLLDPQEYSIEWYENAEGGES